MTTGLTVQDILRASDTKVQSVDCPEWGGTVYVRTISGDARDKFELTFASGDADDRVGCRAQLVAAAMCDKDGAFLRPTENEIKALGAKASGPLDRCFDAVQQVSAMRQQDVDAMEKNSQTTDGDS